MTDDAASLTAFEIGILQIMVAPELKGGTAVAYIEDLVEKIWPYAIEQRCGDKRHRKALYAMKGQLGRMRRLRLVDEWRPGSDAWAPTPHGIETLKSSGFYRDAASWS